MAKTPQRLALKKVLSFQLFRQLSSTSTRNLKYFSKLPGIFIPSSRLLLLSYFDCIIKAVRQVNDFIMVLHFIKFNLSHENAIGSDLKVLSLMMTVTCCPLRECLRGCYPDQNYNNFLFLRKTFEKICMRLLLLEDFVFNLHLNTN